MESYKLIARNSFWSTLDRLLSLLFGVVSSIAVARIMGPDKLGHYNFVLWLSMVAAILGMFGIPFATGKYAAEFLGLGDVQQALGVIQLTLRLQVLAALAIVAIGIAATLYLSPPSDIGFTLIAVLSLFPGIVTGIFTQANTAAQSLRPNAIASVASGAVNFAGVCLVLWREWDLVGLTTVLLISRFADMFIRSAECARLYSGLAQSKVRLFQLRGAYSVGPDLRRRIVRFCGQVTALQLIETFVWSRTQLLFLRGYCAIQQVAFYSLGFNITERLLFLPHSFSAAVGARLMVQAGGENGSMGRTTAVAVRYLLIGSLPMMFGLAAISTPFTVGLYGEAYRPAALPLMIGSAFGISRVLIIPIRQLLTAADRQNFMVVWTVFAAALNLLLSYLWIPLHGAVGAAVVGALTQVLAIVGLWWFVHSRFAFPVEYRRAGGIGLAAGVMGVAAFLIGRSLPPLPALAAAIVVGAALYVVLLRLTGAFDGGDFCRLSSLEDQLPRPIRSPYRRTIGFLCREPV